ncbi:hypothetical protein CDD81_5132 [Ophiocordyceps australis]|uniref:RING-type domain-containing protein n=1 Tax=Ophiocordyceps australis TaxID=1399860 RepID=A0A2C5Y5Q5_9HYPO|nr:hypothetical protein CDD81_5132 [Ophiocordyceps australis]
MSSLVSEFIINPVLRQARRFSEISRSARSGDDDADCCGQSSHGSPGSDAIAMGSQLDSTTAAHTDAVAAPRSRPDALDVSPAPRLVDNTAAESSDIDDSDLISHIRSAAKVRSIPEDDGMGRLRSVIQAINAQDISSAEKARRIHDALLEGYRASQSISPSNSQPSCDDSTAPLHPAGHDRQVSTPSRPLDSLKFWYSPSSDSLPSERFLLSEADLTPTYAPIRQPKSSGEETPVVTPPDMSPPLGCHHYERNVKLQCSTCAKWYTCRLCHDAKEDHNLIRNETKNMLCMLCSTPQRASDVCVKCGEVAAQYYCKICKLWENRPTKPIYHCHDCGICRRGRGLGKDFFHCQKCQICIGVASQGSHRCIERSTDCDCPICGEYLFTSPRPVVFMACGHSIHRRCYNQHIEVSYKCPICSKSLLNMESQFRNMDAFIATQPMPPSFRDTKVTILCNDCSAKSTVPYHWIGLKCSICRSYNTVQLSVHNNNGIRADSSLSGPDQDATQALEATNDAAMRLHMTSTATRADNVPDLDQWQHSPDVVVHQGHNAESDSFMASSGTGPATQGWEPLDRRTAEMVAMGWDPRMLHASSDADSDDFDDVLGIFRSGFDDDDGSEPEGDESGQEDDDDQLGEDDEEEDNMFLYGHR